MGLAVSELSADRREAIARDCFTVKKPYAGNKGKELVGFCPFHEDDNPSFSYNIDQDAFNCLGCGAKGDLVALWCHHQGLDVVSGGLVAFKEQFGISGGGSGQYQGRGRSKKAPQAANAAAEKSTAPPWEDECIEEAVLEGLPPLDAGWLERMRRERAWDARALLPKLDLRLYRPPGKAEERIAFPVRDHLGRLANIRLYRPGAAVRKVISWSDPLCPTCGKAWSWDKQEKSRVCRPCGSRPRTFGQSRLLPPPPSWEAGPIWVVEGEPDLACAISHGLNAVTQTAGCRTWKKGFSAPFRGRDVIIALDADKEGLAGAELVGEALVKVAKSVRIVVWPDFMWQETPHPTEDPKREFSEFVLENGAGYPVAHGEDLTDFFARHGRSLKDLQDLLVSAITVEKPEADPPVSPGPRRFFRLRKFKSALLADALLQDMDLLAHPQTGQLYRWSGKHWAEFHIERLEAIALAMLEDEGEASRAGNAARQVYLRSILPEDRGLNDHHDLVCLANGMLDIGTGEFRPHDKKYLATQILDFPFDEKADCPDWLPFLQDVIPDPLVRTQLQQFFGYCLTRETRYGKCLLLHGPGSDGKSTILKILQAMIGTHNCSAVQMGNLEDPFERATLHNKLLNIATEEDKKAFGSAFFKAIVTGDFINASFKHKDFFTFRPYAKLAFASNFFPQVSDNTDGYYRRILGIKFTKQFGPGFDAEEDKYLEDKLLRQLPGIFLWSLEGLALLREHDGFVQAERTTEFISEYKRHNSPVHAFVDEFCRLAEPGEDLRIATDVLYKRYCKYCNENGHRALSKPNFGVALRSAARVDQGRLRGTRERCYVGIDLLPAPDLAGASSPGPPPPEAAASFER